MKFGEAELVRNFEKGLWVPILQQIPVTKKRVDRSTLTEFAECMMAVEEEVRYIMKLSGNMITGKSEKSLISPKPKTCFYWRKFGKCKFSDKCFSALDHTAENKLIWENKWIESAKTKKQAGKSGNEHEHDKKVRFVNTISRNVSLVASASDVGPRMMFFDSGSSWTETDKKEYFGIYEEYGVGVGKYTEGAGGKLLRAVGWGIVPMKCRITGTITLMRTDYVPGLGYTLISRGQMDRNGHVFDGGNGVIYCYTSDKNLFMRCQMSDAFWNLYEPQIDVVAVDTHHLTSAMSKERQKNQKWFSHETVNKSALSKSGLLLLAHQRMTHIDVRKIVQMGKDENFIGFEEFADVTEKELKSFSCDTCTRVKPLQYVRTRKNVEKKKRTKKAKKVRKEKEIRNKREIAEVEKNVTVASDVCGPLVESLWGNTYLKANVVKELGVIWGAGLPSKESTSLAADTAVVITKLENKGWKVTNHVSDNAREFTGGEMKILLDSEGIEQSVSVGYDSNANPRAERAIRTILEAVRCILHETRVPAVLWDFGVEFVCFVRNSLIRRVDQREVVGFSQLTKSIPKLPKHIHVFGSLAFAKRHKPQEKGLVRSGNVRSMYVGPGDLMFPKMRGAMFIDLDMFDAGEPIEQCIFASRRYRVSEGVSCNLRIEEDDDVVKIYDKNHGFSNFSVTMTDAMKSEDSRGWEEAIKKDLDAINNYGTYRVVTEEEVNALRSDLAGGKVFPTRFVLDQKIDKKKARLVVQAYDYCRQGLDDVHSPVVRENTLFMILNMFLSMDNWKIAQWDAINAFLQSKFTKGLNVVVRSPDKKELWLLLKALYGHPLASKMWYLMVDKAMKKAHWKRSVFDPCCYLKHINNKLTGIIIVHVDDFLATGE